MVNGFSGQFEQNTMGVSGSLNPYQNAISQAWGGGQFVQSLFVSFRSQMYSGGNLGSQSTVVEWTQIGSGKYKILKELGAGAYGTVYLAEDQSGNKVAIKVPKQLRGHLKALPGLEAKHEIQMLKLMENNPWAVRILNHDDITIEAFPKIVLEYTPYGSLRDQLGKKQKTVGQRISCAFKLMKDAAVGLVPMKIVGTGNEEHEVKMEVRHDMAHGDVKPDNVLVFKNNNRVVFKTADWGSAHLTTDTTWDELKGTPAYMAPEVLETGGLCSGTACDVWSTAMTVIDIIRDAKDNFEPCKMLADQNFNCINVFHIGGAVQQWFSKSEQDKMKQIQERVIKPSFGQSKHDKIPYLEYYLLWMLRNATDPNKQRMTWNDVAFNIKNEWTEECTPALFDER